MENKLTPEEIYSQYEHLAHATLHKTFRNPEKLAKSRHLQFDDMLQFCRLGLWQGCRSYCPEKHKSIKLQNFLIKNIRWVLFRQLQIYGMNHLYYKSRESTEGNTVALLSMSCNPYKNDDDDTFYDIVSQDNIFNFGGSMFPNPELTTLSNDKVSRMFSKLSEKEQQIIHMRLKEELTYQEIADRLGCTKQGIGMIFKRMYDKYKDYLYNIAEVTT
jgi:RNA polymerase sigma factor (sigma-70 family)